MYKFQLRVKPLWRIWTVKTIYCQFDNIVITDGTIIVVMTTYGAINDNKAIKLMIFLFSVDKYIKDNDKNIARYRVHTIGSWPNPELWLMIHISDLMMIK